MRTKNLLNKFALVAFLGISLFSAESALAVSDCKGTVNLTFTGDSSGAASGEASNCGNFNVSCSKKISVTTICCEWSCLQ